MNNHQTPESEDNANDENDLQATQGNIGLRQIIQEVQEIKEKLAVKDVEIDDLYDKLQSANSTISNLQEKIAELENHQNQINRNNREDQDTPTSPHRTLLLGDTNLSHVRAGDLREGCSVRTIQDADINLLRSWINEQLSWTPDSCILFGGISDVLGEKTPLEIIDDLSLLISDLKSKNAEMNIYVCQLVPTLHSDELQAKINELNDEIFKCCETNNINILNVNLPFRLATDDIDEMCYDFGAETPGLYLNRLGAIRLLDWIAKKCPNFELSDEWNNIKRDKDTQISKPKENVTQRSNANRQLERHNNVRTNNTRSGRRQEPSRASYNHYYQPHRNQVDDNRFQSRHLGSHSRQPRRVNPPSFSKRGCYNCGEFNHQQMSCRFDHKVQCTSCFSYGHKNKLCSFYNR
ncbi:MAG: hypothetical protein AAGK97_05700 [Bacteroidota bacterium]